MHASVPTAYMTSIRQTAMALRELPIRTAAALSRDARPMIRGALPLCRRNASCDAVREVESSSFEMPPPSEELVKGYDPVARSKLRRRGKKELPPSRCELSIQGRRDQQLTQRLQVPVPLAQVLPRTSTSPSTTARLRCRVEIVPARSVQPSPSGADLPEHYRLRPPRSHIPTLPSRLPGAQERAAAARMDGRLAILQKPPPKRPSRQG